MTATVTAPLLIEAGDVQIDAVGEYDAETGRLQMVRINGRDVETGYLWEGLCRLGSADIAGDWHANLTPARLTELATAAMQDAAADRGDYLRDIRRDRDE